MRTLISSLLLASASITSAYATTITQPSIVEMETSVGTITIQLNWDKAPISSQNFLTYVNSSFYKNTFFHRVVKGTTASPNISIIQGGGFDAPTMKQKTPNAPIVNEANNGLHNTSGTIAMARTSDPNSATSQFFINFDDNSASLDFGSKNNPDGYAVFGTVINGMSVATAIGNFSTIGAVPYNTVYDCGFNFCAPKIIIDATYPSNVVDTINSWTRIMVNGSGRVTSTPTGLSCVSKCTLKKPFGTAITLTAKPSVGYDFTGWSGDCSGNAATPLVLDTKAKNNNCTATFTKKVVL